MLFSFTLMTGTLISISSSTWFMAWIGLEMNLLSLTPLMKTHKNKYSAEATIKYFITQAMASATLIFSIILFLGLKNNLFELATMTAPLISLPLLMKMGCAPFHFWLPEVVSGISWNLNMLILTWQKIAPMIMMFYTIYSPLLLSMFIIISSAIGSIGGLNQTCMRKLLVYSSINHIGWMLSCLMNSLSTWLIYFIIYSLINMNIILLLKNNKIYFFWQMNKISFNKSIKFLFMMNFLSLGGLPPFLGFFIKWMVINEMVINNFIVLTLMMILFTLIALFFYTRITFSTLTLSMMENMKIFYSKTNFMMSLISFISLSSLILSLSMNSLI
uniref:NADH-ubiquinone oxidoreductase chain 2 n=1 Tax=Pityogenes bidentatus TaxID=1325381 RepID=A0A2D0VPU7_9CUCU|nr:NADH dehydrogenase subunit 2 [Pityogenes bidentatus]AOY40163.1 NADH dehydrogenase subunit 2 [Pityogenes bidentatus]